MKMLRIFVNWTPGTSTRCLGKMAMKQLCCYCCRY